MIAQNYSKMIISQRIFEIELWIDNPAIKFDAKSNFSFLDKQCKSVVKATKKSLLGSTIISGGLY